MSMTTLPSAPTTEQRNPLNMLRFALEVARQPAHDETGLRARTIKSLLIARDALKPVVGENGDLVQRLQRTLVATSKSLPCEDDPEVLIQRISRLAQALEAANGTLPAVTNSQPSPYPKTNSVFVIHGHDELNRLRLEKMLRDDFGLNPVVILSRPGLSQTTIEKFEKEADSCAYAVALFTPDDEINNENSGQYVQARPNAIFEAGWFAGRLGRNRVLILLKQGTKIHSDLEGINQHRFSSSVDERYRELQKELQAAGLILAK